ncbi:MAG TPA: DsrE family protein [Candidatus Dormibacteraeota bacterium]|nr:DsrE family protein [Candidatus Dormibacteraeota bacterium]
MNLVLVLTAGPRSDGAETVLALATAAAELGHLTSIFLAGDGVLSAAALAGRFPVTLCEADLRWRQPQPAEFVGVRRGSLADLARMVRDADQVLRF